MQRKQHRGMEREQNLDKDIYFTDHYFSLPQLASLSHQINEIYKLNPKNILEIGIGNGLTSQFLKKSGIEVTTVDINPDLEPDICCSIEEIPKYINNKKYDLIVCCEVLEHLPFTEFEKSIKIINDIGDRVFITLPNYRTTFGIGGFFRFPKFPLKEFSIGFELKLNKNMTDGEHFWEVGYTKETTRKQIFNKLGKYYSKINTGKFTLNPYHMYFTAEK